MNKCFLIFGLIIFSLSVFAIETEVLNIKLIENKSKISKKSISGLSSSSKNGIQLDSLKKENINTTADVIKTIPMINQAIACMNCGAKRISLSGMKSEMATLMIDNIPIFSSLSQFYGLDAFPIDVTDSLKIENSSLSSQLNFESLAGSIIFDTKSLVRKNQSTITASVNDRGDNFQSLSNEAKFNLLGYKHFLWFGLGRDKSNYIDLDKNKISEVPEKSNYFTYFKNKLNFNDFNLTTFFQYSNLKTIGGNTEEYEIAKYSTNQASKDDFENNDVRKKYIGSIDKISDLVKINRIDGYVQAEQILNSNAFLNFDFGFSKQKQDSIFLHGYDYNNINQVKYYSFSPTVFIDSHELLFKIESRFEDTTSTSKYLYHDRSPKLKEDDLNYDYYSFGIRDDFTLLENLNFVIGLKLEKMDLDWKYFNTGKEINQYNLQPLLGFIYKNDRHKTVSSSFSIRHRAPLLQFESQHGNDHDGYQIEVIRPEKNINLNLKIEENNTDMTWFADIQFNYLKSLVYGIDRSVESLPTRFVNSDRSYKIMSNSFGLGKDILDNHQVNLFFEKYFYENEFKRTQQSPLVEAKLQVNYQYILNRMKFSIASTWFGPQDLSYYGYNNHYNKVDEDITAPDPYIFSEQKKVKVPSYFIWDINLNYSVSEQFKLDFGILNIFNFTQTITKGDSPLTWAKHGDHYHLDNMHTWGNLVPRTFKLGARYSF